MNTIANPIHLQSPGAWADAPSQHSALRRAISQRLTMAEHEAVQALLDQRQLDTAQESAVKAYATALVKGLKAHQHQSARANLVQNLLQTYTLSSDEGIALMCLAESLLRIPDAATRDAIIRDKLSRGQWQEHLGQSESIFVNAATWGLLITGRVTRPVARGSLGGTLHRWLQTGSAPVIRQAVAMAMRIMGQQFVAGVSIQAATQHAKAQEQRGYRYSYDMLGEAAMTDQDAQRYLDAYAQAIDHIGRTAVGNNAIERAGISIKLSALHPRYQRAQRQRVITELYPRLFGLVRRAKAYGIGINIDAEESERLEISLDLLERLCFEPELAGYDGIGFVIQAYQKRCPAVVDWLVDLAQRSQHRLMVRLVKGAYWDSEIKRAQVEGLTDYPVYTQKAHTDLSYLVCAEKLLRAPAQIYPQFATHNAHTVAAIFEMAGPASYEEGQYEFQCLHGMGEALYDQVVGTGGPLAQRRPCRIYAPVGSHETLLAYLVRRLLENGANTSFINQVADKHLRIDDLIRDPIASIQAARACHPQLRDVNPHIAMPSDIYGTHRRNSAGVDLDDESALHAIGVALQQASAWPMDTPIRAAVDAELKRPWVAVHNPAQHQQIIGRVQQALAADVDSAMQAAQKAANNWAKTHPVLRAAMLMKAADAIEQSTHAFIAILMLEAGKTAANALAEVREAVDFLRYYAAQIDEHFDIETHRPLGPVVAISPWNFPLAIFTGQVAAALAAGNPVLAKPAEQTPLVAAMAVDALHQAGVPADVLQLLPGDGDTVGAALVVHPHTAGVVFTGSTEVARLIQHSLAGRLNADGQPIPLIAETGGQNAMIVDSSALTEQVVADVLSSAFDSAGQRCSALRVLCLQADIADKTMDMLRGAMLDLKVGNPCKLDTDVGPVIDSTARVQIEAHIQSMQAAGQRVTQCPMAAETSQGTFVAPTLIEIDDLSVLKREIFGPVCHVIRYHRDTLDTLVEQINALGYGLTLGVHSRNDATLARVQALAHVGNLYINRNQVGAVVGVQPFGGEGLSGTGPKAGGPLYLYRLLSHRPDAAVHALVTSALETPIALPGPTGEHNTYRLLPRANVLCWSEDAATLQSLVTAVQRVGGAPICDATQARGLGDRHGIQTFAWHADSDLHEVALDFALVDANDEAVLMLQAQLARRPGPIIGMWRATGRDAAVPMERLVVERSVSTNTTASGGNVGLMRLGAAAGAQG